MPSESILFAPSIDERQLDKETDQVNDQLSQVGEDVPMNFDAEMPDAGGLDTPGGGGGGMGGGAGAGAAAGLASKIPKPVAGVTAAAAIPMAITGAVGVGLLNEMRKSSAMLQTDASLMGVAVDNFFREPGNILSEFITRPIAKAFLDFSLDIDEAFRSLRNIADGDILPDGLGEFERRLGAAIDVIKLMPGFVGELGDAAEWAGSKLNDVGDMWPGWPNIGELWPGWPDINVEWPGWPNVKSEWANIGWPNISAPNWSNLRPAMPDWSGISLNFPDWLDRWTEGEADTMQGNTDTGSTGTFDQDYYGGTGPITDEDALVGVQSGGRITQTGVAEVHRGELVSDPDRLVSELASAVSQSTGGGGGTRMDTRNLERKLDDVNRNLKQLQNALDVTLEVGSEEIGRAVADGKQNRMADTDPLI